jgi:hypothetical protein
MVVLNPGEMPDLPADRVRCRVDLVLEVSIGQAVEYIVHDLADTAEAINEKVGTRHELASESV